MNKLQIYDGGHKLKGSQITFLQDAIRNAITGLASGYGTDFIISGMQITTVDLDMLGDGYSFSAGYACIGGEICQFDAQNIVVGDLAANSTLVVSESNGTPQLLYNDGVLRDVYKIRKCQIANTPGVGTLADVIKKRVNDDWKNITLVTGAGAVPNYTPQYRINNGYMELRGRAINNSGGTMHYLSDVAQMYGPIYDQHCPVAIDGLAPTWLRLRFVAGDKKMYLANWLNNTTILLDGIRFRLL